MDINIDDAIKELKEKFNVTTHEQLAEALGLSSSAIDMWKNREKLPTKYEKFLHNVNIEKNGHKVIGNGNYVGNKNFIINEKLPILNEEDIELIANYKKLSLKKQEYYSYLIKADMLKEEMENEIKENK